MIIFTVKMKCKDTYGWTYHANVKSFKNIVYL